MSWQDEIPADNPKPICHCQRKPGIAPHWFNLLEGCPKDGPTGKPEPQPPFRGTDEEAEELDAQIGAEIDEAEEIAADDELWDEPEEPVTRPVQIPFPKAPEPEFDPVNHPRHYTAHPSGIECIDVIETMPYCIGAAIKYLWRCDLKANPIEDLEKARWYIDREISRRRQASWEEP